MYKNLKRYIYTSLISSALFIILGLILIIFPETSLNIIRWIIVILLMLIGIYSLIVDTNKTWLSFNAFSTDVLSIIFAVILIAYPKTLSMLLPIVLGIWIISFSSFGLKLSLTLRKFEEINWLVPLFISLLSIACGIILIINPLGSMITITKFIGIVMISFSITNIVNMILFKRHVENISKYLMDLFSL